MKLTTVLSVIACAAGTTGVVASANKIVHGLTEVDLIFPRNGTYAPMNKLPIVFAIQNSTVARSVNLQLNYTISTLDAPYRDIRQLTSTVKVDLSDSDETQFAYGASVNLDGDEGTYIMRYNVFLNTVLEGSGQGTGSEPHVVHGFDLNREPGLINEANVTFTTKKGFAAIDLVALTSSKQCSGAQAAAFDVLKPEPPSDPENVIALAWPAPSPEPCQVKIRSDEAASISSELGLPTQSPGDDGGDGDSGDSESAASRGSIPSMMVVALLFVCGLL